ncbi:MAG: TIGR01212 family radical SAM protein [Thermodesulfovibrionales bacterium]|nr:TIGR01212 family radical SAM protein [Thermodesulfovibrionales bacterium]
MVIRFTSFGRYLRRRFNRPVYKVNVDAGFTCPNRDGRIDVTGCIYCNNNSFRPSECKPSISIKEQMIKGMNYIAARYGASRFIVYFQPFTNTYAPVSHLETLYLEALSHPSVIGLAIGTRPDCVDEEKIALLEFLAKKHFILIEYGLQSIHDKTLKFIRRGHDYQTFLDAINLSAGRGIHLGVHTIVGFPTETREEMLQMADELSRLPLEFIKIHQLQIIKGTPLADYYENNKFPTFQYEEYIDFLIDFIERLSPNMVIQRFFATAPEDILIAPKWGRTRHQLMGDIEKRFIQRNAFQGSKCLCHRH